MQISGARYTLLPPYIQGWISNIGYPDKFGVGRRAMGPRSPIDSFGDKLRGDDKQDRALTPIRDGS